MKILMWHCKEYAAVLTGISDVPKKIIPEPKRFENEQMSSCIVAMITIELDDTDKTEKAKKEIVKFAMDTKSANIVIMPFVHLSNKIADSEKALEAVTSIENELKSEFSVLRSHFGHHKELTLHTFGHKTNVRFREL